MRQKNIVKTRKEKTDKITQKEVLQALLKIGNATDYDNITAKMLKFMDEEGLKQLTKLNEIVQMKIPEEYNKSIIHIKKEIVITIWK